MVVNSNRRFPFTPEGVHAILPWSGVVVVWDGDEVIDVVDAMNMRSYIDREIERGTRATSVQVFQSQDPSGRRAEIEQLIRARGIRRRSATG